jgi:hypothetical protein
MYCSTLILAIHGYCLQDGIGVPINESEATKYFKLAADQNDANAQYLYGFALLSGGGVTADHTEAIKHFRLATEHNMPRLLQEFVPFSGSDVVLISLKQKNDSR